jgi:hypothetical protein
MSIRQHPPGEPPAVPRARLPWTCDPRLRWETGQAGAVLAAVGILRELLTTDLDPGYWRLRVGDALEALDAAVAQ